MDSPSLSRRRLLGAAATLGATLLVPAHAHAASTHGVLYYGWADSIDDTLDSMGAVVDAVSTAEALDLEVVRNSGGQFGVLGRYKGNEAAIEALAASHDLVLRERAGADDTLAATVELSEVHRVYNVSYGLGPNRDALIARYDDVARLLGPGVAKSLVVERTTAGNYALVYKRYGDLDTTRTVANRHASLLRRHRLDASFIQERNHPVVFDGTTDPNAELAIDEPPVADPPQTATDPETPPEADPEAPPEVEPEDPPEVEPPDPEAAPAPAPPVAAVAAGLKPGSSALKSEINDYIQGLRRKGRVSSNEKTSWLVYDLEADVTIASINADVSRQAASMIKPFVVLAFFHEAKRGRFIYGKKSTAQFEAMIQRSSNTATNWAIDQVGGPAAVQRILDEHYGHLFKQTAVVETIAAGGRTYRNMASADDYARYLRALWRNQLPYSAEQKRLLNLPGRDRLYYGAPSIPVGTRVYNKTGSTSRLCGDMGILVAKRPNGKSFPYVIVGIIEKGVRTSNYGSWISARGSVIRKVSDLTYRSLRTDRGLS